MICLHMANQAFISDLMLGSHHGPVSMLWMLIQQLQLSNCSELVQCDCAGSLMSDSDEHRLMQQLSC